MTAHTAHVILVCVGAWVLWEAGEWIINRKAEK